MKSITIDGRSYAVAREEGPKRVVIDFGGNGGPYVFADLDDSGAWQLAPWERLTDQEKADLKSLEAPFDDVNAPGGVVTITRPD